MRRLIRWISLAALAVLLLPILHDVALQHQVYNNPPESVSTFLGLRSLGDLPHFEHVLAFVGGLTLGIWIDALLTRTDWSQSKKYALADKAVRAREAIQLELGKVDRQRDHASPSLLADVNSLMLDLRKAGIPVPLAPAGTEVEKWLDGLGLLQSHRATVTRWSPQRSTGRSGTCPNETQLSLRTGDGLASALGH
jgi:hypothetical protein